MFRWAGARWCSAAWAGRIGRNCWTAYSCSRLQTVAPGRSEPGAQRRAGGGGRRRGAPAGGSVAVGGRASSPHVAYE